MKKNNMKLLLILSTAMLVTSACGGNNNSGENLNSVSTVEPDVSNEVLMLKNYVTNLNLKGYVGTNLKNNINYWQKSAYDNNKNIVTQIYEANHNDSGTSLSSVLGSDYFGVDGYYDIDVVSKDEENYIGWKMKYVPGSFGDRDIRFSNDPNAKTDWKGAKELWIHVDNSEISGISSLRLAFEDDYIGRESYELRPGKTVYLYENGVKTEVLTQTGGYVDIPANFKGYLAIPLDSEHYVQYWNEGSNNSIDLGNIAQFQIALKGTSKNIDKTFYMNDFAIVGNVNGSALPDNITSENTYKVIWDISNLSGRNVNKDSEPSGLPWYGEFVGKLLTGMAFSYKASKDNDLSIKALEILADLEEAQGEDGYLGTYQGGARYSINASNWDLWNQYHCVVGLLEWYNLTNEERYFDVAKKTLDCIYETFKDRSYLVKGGFETNRGIAHAYAMMYQVSNDEKYLDEAIRIIHQDCQDSRGWYQSALTGRHFYNSSSARWEVLHMIMTLAILYEETEESEYYDVMSYLWYDILDSDVHNDGGFTTNEGAVGDPYREGVIETCCTIAWSAFSTDFYKISKKVEVADELERSYFNALLGSLLDDDKYCTYNTPVNGIRGSCGGYDGRRVKSQQDISFQFNSGSPDMNCCQANFARGIGQIAEWAALTDNNALYLNYYGNSAIETKVGGHDVTITETTSYPLNGEVKITISGLDKPTKFDLKLRVPSWSKDSTINIGSETKTLISGEYYSLDRTWSNGDTFTLKIGLQFTAWKGEKSQLNKSSIYYGPILLALDEYHLSKSDSSLPFERDIPLSSGDFANAVVSSGAINGAWLYVDIPYDSTYLRLTDFASSGKYNGASQPCSYQSWLALNDNDPLTEENTVNRWKVALY